MITQAQEGRKARVLNLGIENTAGALFEKGEGIYIIFYIPSQSSLRISFQSDNRV